MIHSLSAPAVPTSASRPGRKRWVRSGHSFWICLPEEDDVVPAALPLSCHKSSPTAPFVDKMKRTYLQQSPCGEEVEVGTPPLNKRLDEQLLASTPLKLSFPTQTSAVDFRAPQIHNSSTEECPDAQQGFEILTIASRLREVRDFLASSKGDGLEADPFMNKDDMGFQAEMKARVSIDCRRSPKWAWAATKIKIKPLTIGEYPTLHVSRRSRLKDSNKVNMSIEEAKKPREWSGRLTKPVEPFLRTATRTRGDCRTQDPTRESRKWDDCVLCNATFDGLPLRRARMAHQ